MRGMGCTGRVQVSLFSNKSLFMLEKWLMRGVCAPDAMGKKKDLYAVVDTRGRVYNTEGLRVVDASIFPLLPAGHPMSTICKLYELGFKSKLGTDHFRCSSRTRFRRHPIEL
jgi:hypothetical protein